VGNQNVGTVNEVGIAAEDRRTADGLTSLQSDSRGVHLDASRTPGAAEPYGARLPAPLDRAVVAVTSHLPDNWLGLRLAIALRRIVTTRIAGDDGLDVVRWGLRIPMKSPRRSEMMSPGVTR